MKCEWIILISKLVKKIMGDEEAFKYAGRLGLGMGRRAGTFQLTSIQALVRREDSWSPQGTDRAGNLRRCPQSNRHSSHRCTSHSAARPCCLCSYKHLFGEQV